MKSRSYMDGPGLSTGMRAAVILTLLVGAYLIFEFGRIQVMLRGDRGKQKCGRSRNCV